MYRGTAYYDRICLKEFRWIRQLIRTKKDYKMTKKDKK